MTGYTPPLRGEWARLDPGEAGLDTQALADAVRFAETHESTWPRDLANAEFLPTLNENEPPEWGKVIGPIAPRGGPSGLVLKRGKIVAEWGDPARVDVTFSIAKSYLAILAGLAIAEGLIPDLDDACAATVEGDLFADPQNASITWRHLLTQTSEWQGSLFGKPDQVDHYRELGPDADNSRKGEKRPLGPPGSHWEYNDVRVNVLSLALLNVFKQPLADVLRDSIMAPIGATDTWSWRPYNNSTVMIDGQPMPSVPGGTHWGGGLHISTYDHARFGLLIQRGGKWQGRQILPAGWLEEIRTPCPLNPNYGYLWWLNTGREFYEGAPESSFFAFGAGSNLIWIDQTAELVLVARWIDAAEKEAMVSAFWAAFEGTAP